MRVEFKGDLSSFNFMDQMSLQFIFGSLIVQIIKRH